MRKRLLFLVLLVMMICSVSAVVVASYCAIPVPEITIDQDIQSFMGRDDYTVDNLVITTRDNLGQRLSYWGYVGTGLIMADFACVRDDCDLQGLDVTVYAAGYFSCPTLDNIDSPERLSVINFRFEIPNERVTARTYHLHFVSHPIRWEDLPIGIDEAVHIALDTAGTEFVQQHSQFSLLLALHRDRWAVSFGSNPQSVSEIQFDINY